VRKVLRSFPWAHHLPWHFQARAAISWTTATSFFGDIGDFGAFLTGSVNPSLFRHILAKFQVMSDFIVEVGHAITSMLKPEITDSIRR
jgi:hypothetical protein